MRNLIRCIPEGILIYDISTKQVKLANKAAYNLFS